MLFKYMDFETIGSCNRLCSTCIRNSHPNPKAVESWFGKNYLPEELIYSAIDEGIAMGFRGGVCLSFYNEPTMDERLPQIAHKVRAYPQLSTVHMNSNADFITPELAAELDGALDFIIVTLYMGEPIKSERAAWLPTLFEKTKLRITDRPHEPTHFTPAYNLEKLITIAQKLSCDQPTIRLTINHRREYMLCCDDLIGNFQLGTYPEIGIEEYWNGRHASIADVLAVPGGRAFHHYCMSCPRGAHRKSWTGPLDES